MSIQTIDTTDLRNNLSATIKSLGKDDILFIKSRGKLTGKAIINDELLEDLLLFKDSDYIQAVAKRSQGESTYLRQARDFCFESTAFK